MPNKNIFCSSPWLHIKIDYDGRFVPCRWQSTINPEVDSSNLRSMSILEFYNSSRMNQFRSNLLEGSDLTECSSCKYEDSFEKVSGRLKQLYRSGIAIESFDRDFSKSHHYELFNYSTDNNGQTNAYPYDFQINLSNVCNSACIMCAPHFSTRLVQDYQKLSKFAPVLFKQPKKINCWADDPSLVEKFIRDIKELPYIDYIHLLGGETLLLESFYTICDALIESGLSKTIYLGTTTNLTVYSPKIENIVTKFSKFHLGLSIESVNPLNDYIRYPSKITGILENLSKYLSLRDKYPDKLHMSLRITPNIFSIFYIDEVIQYMCDNDITGESCNILIRPECLRMELMPENIRLLTIEKLNAVINKNELSRAKVVNIRDNNLTREVISTIAFTYVDFLENLVLPSDGEKQRHDLVTFLHGFESIRGNSILDYAPEYETFLKAYGYTRPLDI
jgi:MoaA/NifB/PqqE/SkfB family radical SAM enzyme